MAEEIAHLAHSTPTLGLSIIPRAAVAELQGTVGPPVPQAPTPAVEAPLKTLTIDRHSIP